jgi:hypothetical protein
MGDGDAVCDAQLGLVDGLRFGNLLPCVGETVDQLPDQKP